MNNTTSEFDKVLNQLKKTQTATHIQNIDLTWGTMNDAVKSKMMLTFLLGKVCSLPLVPNFTAPEVVSKLGLNNQDATLIQSYNSSLLMAQGLLQKCIIGEYTITSIVKELADNAIDLLPQSDMSQLIQFIQNYEDVKADSIQKGGNPQMLIKGIIFLIYCTILASAGTDLSIIKPSSNTKYKDLLTTYSVENLEKQVVQQQRIVSPAVDVSKMVTIYDKTVEEENKQALTWLISQLSQLLGNAQKNGTQILKEYADEFNKRSEHYSEEIQDTCLSLMQNSYDKGIFKEWTDIDTIEETNQKLKKAKTWGFPQ